MQYMYISYCLCTFSVFSIGLNCNAESSTKDTVSSPTEIPTGHTQTQIPVSGPASFERHPLASGSEKPSPSPSPTDPASRHPVPSVSPSPLPSEPPASSSSTDIETQKSSSILPPTPPVHTTSGSDSGKSCKIPKNTLILDRRCFPNFVFVIQKHWC